LRTGNLCCATIDLLVFRKEAIVAAVSPRHTLCGHAPESVAGIARNPHHADPRLGKPMLLVIMISLLFVVMIWLLLLMMIISRCEI